jgi:putative methyltransferase (TIGR04325 family)
MLKALLRSLTPPVIWNALHRLRRGPSRTDPRVTFRGDYLSWDEVLQHCGKGYAEASILERVAAGARKARDGKVAYEADGLTSNTPLLRYPLLFALSRAASEHDSPLWVLDFGGSLGSSYFQHRHLLKEYPGLKWIIVEQEHFVRTGKKEFEDGCLTFVHNLSEVPQSSPGLLLLSGVITYLPEPYKIMQTLSNLKAAYVFVDRLNLIPGKDRLTLETVPPEIYPAQYPCWFLNRIKFLDTWNNGYELLDEMDCADVHYLDDVALKSNGYLFKRR